MREDPFTLLQGQHLAFIADYTTIHGRPPAESDLRQFFRVTPPTIHNMIIKLESLGLIRRIPRQSRSIEVLIPREQLPYLSPVST